jgi:hypothetical protein
MPSKIECEASEDEDQARDSGWGLARSKGLRLCHSNMRLDLLDSIAASFPRTSLTCPGSAEAPRKGLTGPRRDSVGPGHTLKRPRSI